MDFKKKILIGLFGLMLTNCAYVGDVKTRSHSGAVLGATTTTAACVHWISTDPYVAASCAVVGAFAGANVMYNSDYDVHNAVFVDHLNTSGNGSSYTNWYNSKTKNSGIIHVTSSYLVGPFKCKDYDATVDITNSWPLVGVGGVKREVVFGTACQTPDGQWIEKP
jgi:surface antigen|tara:strand:+ start:1451 stop:1945 length:495 start_codon:yes stop_codon:yes gene_type:complete